jgi:RHS repeat-associated protein
VYDGNGRRHQKVAGSVTTTYVHDGVDLAEERPGAGGTIRYWYSSRIDDVLAKQDAGGAASYYAKDHLGSVRQVTDATGATTLVRDYDSWGNLLAGGSTPGYAFTGREWEPEAGLHYYRARYYDARVARFYREDPAGVLGGLNRYTYVGNNPLNRSDPLGLIPVHLCPAGTRSTADAWLCCWNGQFALCAEEPDWKTFPEPVKECLKLHESLHANWWRANWPDPSACGKQECSWPPCTNDSWPDPDAGRREECWAYAAQLKCLANANDPKSQEMKDDLLRILARCQKYMY